MPGSAAYARIHRDVMQIVSRIPRGRLTTYAAIGAFLDVVPRQVAFLLARQNDEVRESVPWWRVVGTDGELGRPKRTAAGDLQRDLLVLEGMSIVAGKVTNLDEHLFIPTTRNTGVKPTPRPAQRGPAPK